MQTLPAGALVAERFAIDELAATGGMSAVYRGRDLLSGQAVAVKIQPAADADARRRFEREVLLLTELRHPAIARYVADGQLEGGELYLAMEWLEGESLDARLRRGALAPRDAFQLAAAICEVLVEIHDRGVVHRDLKPANVFLVGSLLERIKLLDFGIAALRRPLASITATGSIYGTPGYMAPEQARGMDVDARADLFSLGCVLYECLAGKAPFLGADGLAVVARILLEDPAPLPDEIGSPALRALVSRLLDKDPARRGSAPAVLAELRSLPAETPPGGVPRRLALTAAEQRFLCVVLVERRAEPERSHRTLRLGEPSPAARELGAALAAVEAHGGRLDEVADGALVATWSFSTAPSDQAASAARCALALRELLPAAPIALATGRGVSQVRSWAGEAIDRAARLLAASSGAPLILVDELSAELLGGRFDVAPAAAGARLEREREPGPGRTLLGKRVPCVGRDRELDSLEALYVESATEPVARVALITAPAGAGKSRLAAELADRLRRRADAPQIWRGHGDALRAGSPFALLRSAIRSALDLPAAEAPEVRAAKVRARMARVLSRTDAARVGDFVAELLGGAAAENPRVAAVRGDPQLMGDQLGRAFEDWLSAECAAHPVVLLLEDLHWGDLPSIKLVDLALRNLAERPLFVLGLARPEVHEVFPRLWSERRPEELRLAPLTRKSSAKLARVALGEAASEAAIERVVSLGDGNALQLEELIRAAADGREAPPQTVLAMLQARLLELDGEARQILRAASVFGQHFWAGGARELLGGRLPDGRLRQRLDFLVEREVIVRQERSRFPGESELGFRHALLHDACYAMLTDEDRALGHRLARGWLEGHGEADALVLAEHCDRGGEPERAIAFWRRAAEQALEGDDIEAALQRARRALSGGPDEATRGALCLLLAEAHVWRGEYAEAAAAAKEAMALLPAGGAPWSAAAGLAAEAQGKLGDRTGLIALSETLLSSAGERPLSGPQAIAFVRAAAQLYLAAGRGREAGALVARIDEARPALSADPRVCAFIDHGRSVRALFSGDLGDYRELKAAAAEGFERAGDRRNACAQRAKLGYACLQLGAHGEAEVELRGALALAERLGLRQVRASAWHNLGLVLALQGQFAEARRLEEQAIAAFAEQRDRRLEQASRGYLGLILFWSGDLEGAAREVRKAVVGAAPSSPARAHAHAHLAQIQLAGGHAESALSSAREAYRLFEEMGGMDEGEALVRLVLAEALHACGARPEAAAILAEAEERLHARARSITEARWRESFLTRVPENARTLRLAAEWAAG